MDRGEFSTLLILLAPELKFAHYLCPQCGAVARNLRRRCNGSVGSCSVGGWAWADLLAPHHKPVRAEAGWVTGNKHCSCLLALGVV